MAADDVRIDELLETSHADSFGAELHEINNLGGTGGSINSDGLPGFGHEDYLQKAPVEAAADMHAGGLGSSTPAGASAPGAQSSAAGPSGLQHAAAAAAAAAQTGPAGHKPPAQSSSAGPSGLQHAAAAAAGSQTGPAEHGPPVPDSAAPAPLASKTSALTAGVHAPQQGHTSAAEQHQGPSAGAGAKPSSSGPVGAGAGASAKPSSSSGGPLGAHAAGSTAVRPDPQELLGGVRHPPGMHGAAPAAALHESQGQQAASPASPAQAAAGRPAAGVSDYASFKGEFQVHVNPSCLGDGAGRPSPHGGEQSGGPPSNALLGGNPSCLGDGAGRPTPRGGEWSGGPPLNALLGGGPAPGGPAAAEGRFGGFGGTFGEGPATAPTGAGLGMPPGAAVRGQESFSGWPGGFPYAGGSGASFGLPQAQTTPRAASTETQLVCEVMRGVRDAMSQHVFPSQRQPAFPAYGQQQGMLHVPPSRPYAADYLGHEDPWGARQPMPEADARWRPEPGRPWAAGERPVERAERPERAAPASRADASVQAEPADVGGGPDLRRTFEGKLKSLRGHLLPDLRARREELLAAIRTTDERIAELRRRCEEAEREAREEFESLRGHLSSHESCKLAMLRHQRDLRSQLVEGIDLLSRRAEAAGHSDDAMAAFLQEFLEIQATAESLRSRSQSLPHVDVPIDDIPLEARERADKLRRFAVMDRLHRAKDLCLWRLEQQRRQLVGELQDACIWLRHMEALLERYAESLAHVCYFCAERFSAGAANTRCIYNIGCSPRSGRPLAPDPRVPSHLWGAGVHFWVPPSAPGPAAAGAQEPGHRASASLSGPAAAAHAGEGTPDGLPGEGLFNARHGPADEPKHSAAPGGGSAAPSRSATPPRSAVPTWWDAHRAVGSGPLPEPARQFPPPAPWAFGGGFVGGGAAGPSSPAAASREAHPLQHQQPLPAASAQAAAAFFDAQLRRIAQACEQRGVDIRSAFRAFDANGDGFLSPQEFRHALSQLRLGLSDQEVSWLAGRLDSNADGMVSYEEFLTHLFRSAHDLGAAHVGQAFVEHFAAVDEPARQLWRKVGQAFRDRGVPLRQVFALFDANGDGVISRDELVSALRLMQRGLSDSDVERLVRDIDVNKDGQVSIHEIANRLQ